MRIPSVPFRSAQSRRARPSVRRRPPGNSLRLSFGPLISAAEAIHADERTASHLVRWRLYQKPVSFRGSWEKGTLMSLILRWRDGLTTHKATTMRFFLCADLNTASLGPPNRHSLPRKVLRNGALTLRLRETPAGVGERASERQTGSSSNAAQVIKQVWWPLLSPSLARSLKGRREAPREGGKGACAKSALDPRPAGQPTSEYLLAY